MASSGLQHMRRDYKVIQSIIRNVEAFNIGITFVPSSKLAVGEAHKVGYSTSKPTFTKASSSADLIQIEEDRVP